VLHAETLALGGARCARARGEAVENSRKNAAPRRTSDVAREIR